MLKKLFKFVETRPIGVTLLALVSITMSIIVICLDMPSPGIAYAMGFLNAAILFLLYLMEEDDVE